ncbi:MAG: MFS transporter [Ignavibacteriales bacterium]|nr:MFS transporter [Ignavibacteriales bacterium]
MNLLATPSGRRVLFTLLYFSEGAPIGFLWWALPTMFRSEGIAIDAITGLTSLLVLPWAFKFLWAPCVDALRSPTWALRSWILSCQLTMGISLLPILFLDIRSDFSVIVVLLLLHAVAAATQDASIDALCIAQTPANERGRMNGWMQAGMLLGRSAFGGGTLLLLSLGHWFLLLTLISAIWIPGVALLISRETSPDPQPSTGNRWRSVFHHLRMLAASRSLWFALLFGSIGGAGYEAVGAVAGPYLVDRGFSTSEVGYFYSLVSVPCMIFGALLGGYMSDRMERKKSVGVFLVMISGSIFMLSVIDVVNESGRTVWTIAALGCLYLCIGLFTASSYALFMDITRKGVGATQFSALMGTTNICESVSAFSIGKLVPVTGYPLGFATLALVSLMSLPLLRLITPPSSAQQPADESI